MSNTTANFIIYNASAGSGKTYTLVRNYLIKILSSNDLGRFKKILAVTFTNKAVAEMKERILNSLYHFSQSQISKEHQSMFAEISKELNLNQKDLQQKAQNVLHYLLHNYTAFNVQTIDKFTQSVIRTFAFDLNLNTNFGVELDSKLILEHSVDELLNKVGKDSAITKTILDYMKSNINEDSSWNIKKSLLEISKIILNENDIPHLKLLENKTVVDFNTLKQKLQQKLFENKEVIVKSAKELLVEFEKRHISNDFKRNSIPKYFEKLSLESKVDLSKPPPAWQNNIETDDYYNKTCPENIKQAIDEIKPEIISVFFKTKQLAVQNEYILRILKNSTQMSLLRDIYTISEQYKKENNVLLISDFNQLIFETIKDQPAPFIYERLGEKFKDFFIDEFQDTSVMQWNNLIPLADNALSSGLENTDKTGSLTLVGDAKQAIYRWRGGKAEQFIEMYRSNETPLFPSANKKVENLGTNFRSYSNLITFNNNFFTYLATQFSSPIYTELYKEGNRQETNSKEGGYVQFEFIEGENAEIKEEAYAKKTYETICNIVSNKFEYKDISILVRTNKQGVLLANYLNEKNIPIISSESLLLQNSNSVQLLINYAKFITNITDSTARLTFFKSVAVFLNLKNKHEFLSKCLESNFDELQHYFNTYNLLLPVSPFKEMPIYEAFEYCIRCFTLHKNVNAYVQFFMDFVYEYANKINLGIIDFIEYWDSKKEKLSIVSPEEKNAVQILSIHKSKGLEYPVVIYPFADSDIYKTRDLNLWMPLNEFSEVFTEGYVSFNKNLFEQYSDQTKAKKDQITSLQELDNFNVLYVALTRAKEQLYIISNHKKEKTPPIGSFQFYFLDFLLASDFKKLDDNTYSLGSVQKKSKTKQKTISIPLDYYINSDKRNHGITQVIPKPNLNNDQTKKVERGNVFHEVLSKINDRSDVEEVLERYENKLSMDDLELLKTNLTEIVSHPFFKTIYNKDNEIFNEREFVHQKNILIPDRVEFDKFENVYIIDYKTGEKDNKYVKQVEEYASIFENLDQKTVKKYIIYLGNGLRIEQL